MTIGMVGRRGQMTLPRSIREKLRVKEGDHVAFVSVGDRIMLVPMTRTLLDLRGSVEVTGPQDFDAIRSEVKRERARSLVESDAPDDD